MASAVEISKGDYVIYVDGDKRKHLVEVRNLGEGTLGGVLDKNRAYSPENVKFQRKHIIANLGPNPSPGTAYGCNVEVYRNSVESSLWGDIHFFRRMKKEEKTLLKDSLKKVGSWLVKRKLDSFLPINVEVRPQKGRYAGIYHWKGGKKDENSRDVMTLRPKDALIDNSYLTYVVAHECFHGIWYNCVPDSIKARWIKLYHSYLKFSEATKKDIENVKKDFFSKPQTLHDYESQFEDENEELVIFKRCIDWVRDNHSLSVQNINTLINNDPDFLEELWPTYEMLMPDYDVVISDYAMTKVEEFFAEAGAFYFTHQQKLPGKISKAMDKTLAASR